MSARWWELSCPASGAWSAGCPRAGAYCPGRGHATRPGACDAAGGLRHRPVAAVPLIDRGIRRRRGHSPPAGCGSRVRGPESCPRTRRMSPAGGECPRMEEVGLACGAATGASSPGRWMSSLRLRCMAPLENGDSPVTSRSPPRVLWAAVVSNSAAKASTGLERARANRMIPRFCRQSPWDVSSFAADLDIPASVLRSSGRVRLARPTWNLEGAGPAEVWEQWAAPPTRCCRWGRCRRSARPFVSPRRPCAACPAHAWGRP